MTLIKIPISHAAPILKRMEALLWDRKRTIITRPVFLKKWGAYRRQLAKTPEYQAFAEAVRRRDDYKCVNCYRPTRMVHHKVQVSEALNLVMSVDNGELRCTLCHKALHPWMSK